MDWQTLFRLETINWLLERNNPSVRYFALTGLFDMPPEGPEATEARAEIMLRGPVPAILKKQHPEGHWGRPEDFYLRSKYKGTVWNLILLAELGADGRDERVRAAAEFVLVRAQDRLSGGFAYRSERGLADPECLLPCLSGNLLWALARLGYGQDIRLRLGYTWLATYGRCDDGDGSSPEGWPYEGWERCWGKHTCMMAVVKPLKALAEIPPQKRSADIQAAIGRGTEWLLQHHLVRRSHNLAQVANPEWMLLTFPWMWNTDALEMLDVLTRLGIRDRRMLEAVEWLVCKQGEDGRWPLERSFHGRLAAELEREGQPSKWATLYALRVLKRFLEGQPDGSREK